MSDLDNREKAFENKFAHDEEGKFRIASRRRKLLGLWAAEEMCLSDEESLNYAMTIVKFGIEDNSHGAVITKILADIKQKGSRLTESQVRLKNDEFEEIAKKQLLTDRK